MPLSPALMFHQVSFDCCCSDAGGRHSRLQRRPTTGTYRTVSFHRSIVLFYCLSLYCCIVLSYNRLIVSFIVRQQTPAGVRRRDFRQDSWRMAVAAALPRSDRTGRRSPATPPRSGDRAPTSLILLLLRDACIAGRAPLTFFLQQKATFLQISAHCWV